MRRLLSYTATAAVLLTGLSFGVPSLATAMNSCSNNGYPSPYTGGASIAKYFHLSDGSTVTITSTGAVIKQSPCGNPYREGWINTADICGIQSAQELNGRLSPGASNPYGQSKYNGCTNTVQSSNNQRPSGNVTIVNNNSQSQSQAQAGSGTQASAAASTTSGNGVSAQAQVLSAKTTSGTVKALPNTGPGNVLMLSGATSALGTIGHLYYSRRKRRG